MAFTCTFRNTAWRAIVVWLLTLTQLLAQSAQSISGRITDETGQALPGVTVLVKGTGTPDRGTPDRTNGTTTSAEGTYRLSVPATNATLVISYVGYLSQEVVVNGRAVIDVKLTPGDKTLSEVVVVGYGTQEKKDLTGAIASVMAKDIVKVPVSGFDQALQGQVAGLQISSSSGAPGGNTNILIRGVGSISGGNEPLFVIDGFPVSGAGVGNPLNTINPSDIESIDVLKDAQGKVFNEPYPVKFRQTGIIRGESDVDYPLLRYADVLLMYAEALNEQGQTATALPFLNQVRKRAGLADSKATAPADLRLALEQERRVELAFESQRWFDLVRTGRFVPVMMAKGYAAKPFQVLYPIPQRELDLNKTLTQNQGY